MFPEAGADPAVCVGSDAVCTAQFAPNGSVVLASFDDLGRIGNVSVEPKV